MLRKLATTALLFFPTATMAQENNAVAIAKPDIEVKEMSLNPLLVSEFLPTVTSCHPVNLSFVKKFVTGSLDAQHQSLSISKLICEFRDIHPVISRTMDIVFNYLPGFKIQLGTVKEVTEYYHQKDISQIPEEEQLRGLYYPVTRVMHIAANVGNKQELRNVINHEFRHALMHTLTIARSNSSNSLTMTNYFPLGEEFEQTVKDYLIEGGEEISKLEKCLIDGKDLDGLRSQGQVTYDKYYRFMLPDGLSFPGSDFQEIKESINEPIKFKGIPYEVVITKVELVEDKALCEAYINDPLWALIVSYRVIRNDLEAYPKDKFVWEMDAHLFGMIPPEYIKAIFKKYYDYIQAHMKKTIFMDQFKSPLMRGHEFSYFDELTEYTLLTNPSLFEVARANEMLLIIRRNILLKVNLDESMSGAKILIKNNIMVNEANICLANIASFKGDRQLAYTYYHRALGNHPSKTNYKDTYFYAQLAYFHVKNYKLAKKLCAHLVNNNDKTIDDDMRKRCQDILDEIKIKNDRVRLRR